MGDRLPAAPRTTGLTPADVRHHPWCGPFPAPEKYRGPHALSRDGWENFTRRLERREEIAVVRSATAGHERVLEVGGGTGELARAVAAQVGRCTAVEPHRDRVSVLRAGPGDGTVGVVEVHPGHAESLPFPDGTFDAVVVAWVLPYVDDLAASLCEIARVCDPARPASVIVIGGAPDNELVALLDDACVPLAGEPPDHQGFLLAAAAATLAEHGFVDLALGRTEAALHFPETDPDARVAAAAGTLVDFWYEGHSRAAAMRAALDAPLRAHFARRPHAVGDQGVVLVARRPAGG